MHTIPLLSNTGLAAAAAGVVGAVAASDLGKRATGAVPMGGTVWLCFRQAELLLVSVVYLSLAVRSLFWIWVLFSCYSPGAFGRLPPVCCVWDMRRWCAEGGKRGRKPR